LDPLTELAREGTRRMLAEVLKAEADVFVARFADGQLEDGRQRHRQVIGPADKTKADQHGFKTQPKILKNLMQVSLNRLSIQYCIY